MDNVNASQVDLTNNNTLTNESLIITRTARLTKS